MDKKEYLQKILSKLEPIRDSAKGLKILVNEGNLGDEFLDVLIGAIHGAVNTAKSELDKRKLQSGLKALDRMKEIESSGKIMDEKDLSDLDNLFDNF